MIASLAGILKHKSPDQIILDVNGVGYRVFIPLSTFYQLPEVGQKTHLFIHTHLREDALHLFGFMDTEERDTFRLLIGISGIGPRLASGILSGIPVKNLIHAIQNGDLNPLRSIPGVGLKTAKRILLELKEKVGGLPDEKPIQPTIDEQTRALKEDLLSALTNLGYPLSLAKKTVRSIEPDINKDSCIEDLLKRCLGTIIK